MSEEVPELRWLERPDPQRCRQCLREHGAGRGAADELLAAAERRRARVPKCGAGELPLPDEPHLASWRRLAAEAEDGGLWLGLRRRFPQLAFPISEGVGKSPAYRRAMRSGEAPSSGTGIQLRDPTSLRLEIRETQAGGLPILRVGQRRDFVSLLRALGGRNEPQQVPPTMGACLLQGVVNGERRRRFLAEGRRLGLASSCLRPTGSASAKGQYQDRLVLLSVGPYAGLRSTEVSLELSEELSQERWIEISDRLRAAHEGTHYLHARSWPGLVPAVGDELVADLAGCAEALGHYSATLGARLLGVEEGGSRSGPSRLESYRGSPPLSDDAWEVVPRLVRSAVGELHAFWARHREALASPVRGAEFLRRLAELSLEEMAAGGWRLGVAGSRRESVYEGE